MFYTFSQNNPGGYFWIDHGVGISSYVIIEAGSQDEAVSKAESLGIVFYGDECPDCCGSRWSYPMEEHPDGPRVYDEPVETFAPSRLRSEHGFCGYVHYEDGRVQGFGEEIEP